MAPYLMKLSVLQILAVSALLILSQGCANPHFLPKLRPLFPGLDDTQVPARSRAALEQAKIDFQLARKGEPPQYARYVGTIPYTESKIYRGNGYTLTLVNGGLRDRLGPQILVESAITGGKPFSYDEVIEKWD
jgi:hypothetical protein